MDINFNNNNQLIQAVVQDVRTKKILRIGSLSKQAYETTISSGKVYIYDTELKKEIQLTAGEYNDAVKLDSIIASNDGKAVVILANPAGSTTGADQFLGSKNIEDLAFLSYLQDFIEKRKREMPEGSYTTKLFTKGVNKISQKVGEEAVETIIEATGGTKDQFIYEASDLIYHLIVLLTEKGVRIEDLARELKARHKE